MFKTQLLGMTGSRCRIRAGVGKKGRAVKFGVWVRLMPRNNPA